MIRIKFVFVKRKEPIKDLVELAEAVGNFRMAVLTSLRIPQLVEWLSMQLKKFK